VVATADGPSLVSAGQRLRLGSVWISKGVSFSPQCEAPEGLLAVEMERWRRSTPAVDVEDGGGEPRFGDGGADLGQREVS
jgi:hypothetical protein